MSKYIVQILSDGQSVLNNDIGIVVKLNGEAANSKVIEVLEKQYHMLMKKNEHYENGVLIFDYYT